MTWGGIRYPWAVVADPRADRRLGGAVGLFAWRIATAGEPFIPPAVLRDPHGGAGTVIAGFFSSAPSSGCRSICRSISSWCSALSASMSGIALIFFMVGTVIGAFAAGRGARAASALQADSDRRASPRHRGARRDRGDPAGYSLAAVAGLLFRHRRRHRHHVSGDHGGDPERGASRISSASPPARSNFFRLLGGTIVVAGFGAIVLGAVDAAGGLVALDPLHAAPCGRWADRVSDFSAVFAGSSRPPARSSPRRWRRSRSIEERPLRGPRWSARAPRMTPRDEPPLAAE